jgi:DNA-binding CsgD family transcriptional regulator
MRVEQYVALCEGLDSPEAAFAALVGVLGELGFELACFSLVTDHTSLAQPRCFALLSNCPRPWVERQRAADLASADPITAHLLDADFAFDCAPHLGDETLAGAAGAAARAWAELGVQSAVCVPLRSSGGALASLVAASTRRAPVDARRLCAIDLVCQHFRELHARLSRAERALPGVSLSDAERHVLTWSARGKTKKEIAIVLGTSPHTVDYHQRKVLKKLEVSSVAAAVARAIALRLLLQ